KLVAAVAGNDPGARRDRAVLALLVRLGLRAGEVAALRLEDLDWRAGVIRVRGKRGRVDALPLPVDVGATLVAYLRRARPASSARYARADLAALAALARPWPAGAAR